MRRFCQAYLDEPTIREAGIAAGYSPRSAGEQATKLLRNVRIVARITALRRGALLSRGIDRAYVISNLADIAEDRTIAGQARVRALELLGKDLGLFAGRAKATTTVIVERRTPRLNPDPAPFALASRSGVATEMMNASAEMVEDPA